MMIMAGRRDKKACTRSLDSVDSQVPRWVPLQIFPRSTKTPRQDRFEGRTAGIIFL